MTRPILGFLTDFGADSAPAICRGVILSIANDAQIVDISHSVRKYAIRDGAYLLWSALAWLPVGVHLAVVDPGVGTDRRPVSLRVARGDVLVGPDNGLLLPAAVRLGGILEARAIENPDLMLERRSSTFHGRDIFAPAAAHLAIGVPFDRVGPAVDPRTLVQLDFPPPVVGDGTLETTVLYVDSFGNVRLSGEPDDLRAAVGDLASGDLFDVAFAPAAPGTAPRVERIPWARTFGETQVGSPLLYENSFGGLAIAVNQGDAATWLGVGVDVCVTIRRSSRSS